MSYAEALKDLLRPLGVYRLEEGYGAGELAAAGSALDGCGTALDQVEREMLLTTAQGSGLEAVDRSQREAGECLGLTRAQNLCYVILPQALATAVPSLCANVIFLLKETSVFSAVALADLMYVAKDLIGMYYKTDEALTMLVCAYLVILLPISILFTLLERRLRYAGFGAGRAV